MTAPHLKLGHTSDVGAPRISTTVQSLLNRPFETLNIPSRNPTCSSSLDACGARSPRFYSFAMSKMWEVDPETRSKVCVGLNSRGKMQLWWYCGWRRSREKYNKAWRLTNVYSCLRYKRRTTTTSVLIAMRRVRNGYAAPSVYSHSHASTPHPLIDKHAKLLYHRPRPNSASSCASPAQACTEASACTSPSSAA